MPSLDLMITFLITTTLFAYIPGPAILYAVAQTMARGRTAGLMASLGIHLGCYVHVIAAASGLSILFHAVPSLYIAVKLLGAAYLIWLGIRMMRRQPAQHDSQPGFGPVKSGRQAFFESITVEVLNPKTALFFLAFLPQFVDPLAAFPVWLQFVLLGTIVNLIFSSADLVCVFFASALAGRLSNSGRFQAMARKAAGAVLIGLGARLAFDRA